MSTALRYHVDAAFGRLAASTLWVAPLLAVTVLALWQPSDNDATAVCPYRRCTGSGCPGCGLTRGLGGLVRGDWATAVAYHPLAPLIAIELLAGWALWVGVRLGAVSWSRLRPMVNIALILHVPLLLTVWLVRWKTGALDLVS